MIKEIIDNLGSAINVLYPTYNIYSDFIGENFDEKLEKPCFFIKLISQEITQSLGLTYTMCLSFDIIGIIDDGEKYYNYYDIIDNFNLNLDYTYITSGIYRLINRKGDIIDRDLHYMFDLEIRLWKLTPIEPKVLNVDININE